MVDRHAVLLDQENGAGDLALCDLVAQIVADLRELLLIEVRAGRNIEGALGADR